MVMVDVFQCQLWSIPTYVRAYLQKIVIVISTVMLKWYTLNLATLNRGDMLTSEQHDVVLFCSVLFCNESS